MGPGGGGSGAAGPTRSAGPGRSGCVCVWGGGVGWGGRRARSRRRRGDPLGPGGAEGSGAVRSGGACRAPRPGGGGEVSGTTRGAAGRAGPQVWSWGSGAALRPWWGSAPPPGAAGRGGERASGPSVRRWPGMPGRPPARGAGASGPRGNLGDKQGRALTGAAGLPRACGAGKQLPRRRPVTAAWQEPGAGPGEAAEARPARDGSSSPGAEAGEPRSVRPGRGEEEEEGRKSGDRFGGNGGRMSVPEGSAAAGVGDEGAPCPWRRGAGGPHVLRPPAGSLGLLWPHHELIEVSRVWRKGKVCSLASGVISVVNLGYLHVSCFSGDPVRNAAYGFKEGEGPKIGTGEDKKMFVRLIASKYFKVVF